VKDKTRAMVDELGHLWVKDALEHALKMKYALMLIKQKADEGIVSGTEIMEICDRAISNR
jgi:hypothetical protein